MDSSRGSSSPRSCAAAMAPAAISSLAQTTAVNGMSLAKQRIQRVLAAGLVVVALVQQPLVEFHARLGQRALVSGETLLGIHPVERTRDVGDALVFALEQRLVAR